LNNFLYLCKKSFFDKKMGCIKLDILDKEYKSEIKVSSRKKNWPWFFMFWMHVGK
jgi:hypothetical protein